MQRRKLTSCHLIGPSQLAQTTAGLASFSSRSSWRSLVPPEPQHDLPAFSTLSLDAVVQSHEEQVQLAPQVHEAASLRTRISSDILLEGPACYGR